MDTETVKNIFYRKLINTKINNIRRNINAEPSTKMDLKTIISPESKTEYKYDGNLSDMISTLIQDCGRFTESYNSDLFITLQSMHKEFEHRDAPITEPMVYAYAIRQSGVDSNEFMFGRINECKYDSFALNYYYRRIYLVYLIPESIITNNESDTRLFVYMDNYTNILLTMKKMIKNINEQDKLLSSIINQVLT